MVQGIKSFVNLRKRAAKYLKGAAKNSAVLKKVRGVVRAKELGVLTRQWDAAEKRKAKAETAVAREIKAIHALAKKVDAKLDISKTRCKGWLTRGQMSDLF